MAQYESTTTSRFSPSRKNKSPISDPLLTDRKDHQEEEGGLLAGSFMAAVTVCVTVCGLSGGLRFASRGYSV